MIGSCDACVVGSGHAACEAALALSRLGKSVIMVTLNPDNVAGMACNPAIGGPGKAQIVREIDALGGEMALAADEACLEIRILNQSKGPAVQSLRAQCDKRVYSRHMKAALMKEGRIAVVQGMVTDVLTGDRAVEGVMLSDGRKVVARAVVLATGVYLESRTIVGEDIRASGPMGEPSARGLSSSLVRLGLEIGRFKTGTSPRVRKDSVDWDRVRKEEGASVPLAFSFMSVPRLWDFDACYSTETCEATHEIIRANISRAPLFNGTIVGTGPRYCPSIEDKVMRFPERKRHLVFLEKESRDSDEIYLLGLSTSLPLDVQQEMLRTIRGLERAVITRPGYAIEYDYVLPNQLKPSLEAIGIPGLFLAGQICGSSGYEEAAAQGLIAGINASRYLDGKEPLILGRDQAYIGVLIDDLVSSPINEPYRMLTARAEYRLLLRQSNADLRLTPIGREIGLVSDERWAVFERRRRQIERGRKLLEREIRGKRAGDYLRRPGSSIAELMPDIPELCELDPDVLEEVETEARYAGFIQRQENEVRRLEKWSGKRIPPGLDPDAVPGLSRETRDKITRYRPATLGRAADVGVSPVDILVLGAYLQRTGGRT
ncbi:MAG: tRNA uridine-5-carboxymethylaminomethyl(34) synthesis enzyme MnmG [Firmicutes bacterium]|nr:tRNA uridine-5-carboxymethylaminomethyl(34) synthesis enzyme MnmG [Candidatus Fermentithermobacillaceae bacterium]